MSIARRVEDAALLAQSGRPEGALLSLLVAIAATSRKRYPRNKFPDNQAFRRFVLGELQRLFGLKEMNVSFRGQMRPLQDVLYEFVRCELAHAGTLPGDVQFDETRGPQNGLPILTVGVTTTGLHFNQTLLDSLIRIVREAPENAAEFPP